MKQRATTSREKPNQIFASELTEVPANVQAQLGKPESIKRTLRRHQRGALPKDPTTLGELVIDDETY